MVVIHDIESGLKAQQTTLVTLRPKSGVQIEEVVNTLCAKLPELERTKFWIDKHEKATYPTPTKVRISGDKLIMEKLTVQAIEGGRYQVQVRYRTSVFRPFLLLFTCFFLLFGIVPGVIVYIMFKESDSAELNRVNPALRRFEVLSKELFMENSQANRNLGVEPNDTRDRLTRLEALHADGSISDSEYEAARHQIIQSI